MKWKYCPQFVRSWPRTWPGSGTGQKPSSWPFAATCLSSCITCSFCVSRFAFPPRQKKDFSIDQNGGRATHKQIIKKKKITQQRPSRPWQRPLGHSFVKTVDEVEWSGVGSPGAQEGSQAPAAPGIHLGSAPWQPRHMAALRANRTAPVGQNKLKPHFKAQPTNQVLCPTNQPAKSDWKPGPDTTATKTRRRRQFLQDLPDRHK